MEGQLAKCCSSFCGLAQCTAYGLRMRPAHEILAANPRKKKSSHIFHWSFFSPPQAASSRNRRRQFSLHARSVRHAAPALFFGSFTPTSQPHPLLQANRRSHHRGRRLLARSGRRARPQPPALRRPRRRLRGALRRVAPPQGPPLTPLSSCVRLVCSCSKQNRLNQ